jgi:hypothetical protein
MDGVSVVWFEMELTLRLIVVAAAIIFVNHAIAAEQAPSCDLFRKRYAKAPQVLSLRLPNSQFYREPTTSRDFWKTKPIPDAGTIYRDRGDLWYDTELYCYGAKFDYIVANIDGPEGPAHPTFDMIAASIYAYTGWDADKVVRFTNEVIKKRSPIGRIKSTELFPGAYVNIANVSFTIEPDRTEE